MLQGLLGRGHHGMKEKRKVFKLGTVSINLLLLSFLLSVKTEVFLEGVLCSSLL